MIDAILATILDPRIGTLLGALAAGHPELGDQLLRICHRESPRCQLVSVHADDAWASPRVRPRRCPNRDDSWSTRGIHGLMAGYSMRFLPEPLRCEPWVLDVPAVSAYVAARRAMSAACDRHHRCRRWRGWE